MINWRELALVVGVCVGVVVCGLSVYSETSQRSRGIGLGYKKYCYYANEEYSVGAKNYLSPSKYQTCVRGENGFLVWR